LVIGLWWLEAFSFPPSVSYSIQVEIYKGQRWKIMRTIVLSMLVAGAAIFFIGNIFMLFSDLDGKISGD